ncbi:TPA: surface-adhesin E family protein [Providencia alcalifaciens]
MKVKFMMLSFACLTVVGCQNIGKSSTQSDFQSSALPAGYVKWFETKSSNLYMAKPDSHYYKGNPDLVQIDIVTSFKKEEEFSGVKMKSMRATHVYDCRKTNKYTERPIGFFANPYATGKPDIPYPETSSNWEIAGENNFNGMFWKKLCEMRADVDKSTDIFVDVLNQQSPLKINDWLSVTGAEKKANVIHISYQVDNMTKEAFQQKFNNEIKHQQVARHCDLFMNKFGMAKPKAIYLDFYIKGSIAESLEIDDRQCQSVVK